MIKEFVILTDKDVLTTAVPLYAKYEDRKLDNLDGYSVSLSNDEPLTYGFFVGDDCPLQLVNAKLLEKHCEFLGEL